ncbi:MAG: class I SAM-dependent rRNA methyltransferase [Pseudomonadales bacterium]|nr:class I SAM-dependent rRNA methyltransferase [Pseudomonadales bacterium]
MDTKVLRLRGNADKRIRAGHVWVYSNEVDTLKTPLTGFTAGDQVVIENAAGKALGTAFVNPNTLICARLISRSPKTFLNKKQIQNRIECALRLRSLNFALPYYRLVFGDSDALPGLVVDRFDDVCVVQISSAGMEQCKTAIITALNNVLAPKSIIFKNDGKMRSVEGLDTYVECVGENCDYLRVVENGVEFVVPIQGAQKTGWFYDHRVNRAMLQPYVQGKRVLDLFSYVGGWGLQAAAFGAEQVVAVDVSAGALEVLNENARLQGVEARTSAIRGDVFEVVEQMLQDKEKFDLVIADPPAFIPRRKDIKAGERAYGRLNEIALRLLSREGILVSASCSMHLEANRHIDLIRAAGRQVDRFVQVLGRGHQGPDHPILPAIPETDYIKAVFVRSLPSV